MRIPGTVLAACMAVACLGLALPAHALEDLPTLYINATGPLTPLDHGLLAVPPVDGSYKILHNAPGMVVVGDTVVLWLVTHDDGRLESYRQIVTARDVDPPFFVDAPAVHVTERTGKRTQVEFPVPVAVDAVDLDVDVVSSHKQNSKFRPGDTTVVFTATDDSGNTATHEMVVRVEERRIRGLVLEVTHDEIRASWDPLPGDPTYRVSLAGPGGDVLEISRTPETLQIFAGLDANTEYVVSVAEAGRRSTLAEASAVTPQPPELYITVPDDIVREAAAPLTRVFLGGLLTPEAWDPAPSISNDAPDAFPVGDTTVTWTATDGTTTISGTQLVTITDTTPPVFSNLPESSTHVATSKQGIRVNFTLPAASDKVDLDVAVSSTHDPGDLFPVGNTTVVLTAVDASGNTAEHRFVVGVDHRVLEFPITDDFSSLDGWEFKTMRFAYAESFEGRTYFSNLTLSLDPDVGRPKPSAKISGDGELVFAYIQKTFELGFPVDYQLSVGFESMFGHDHAVERRPGYVGHDFPVPRIFAYVPGTFHPGFTYSYTTNTWATPSISEPRLMGSDTVVVGIGVILLDASDRQLEFWFDSFALSDKGEDLRRYYAGSSDDLGVRPEPRMVVHVPANDPTFVPYAPSINFTGPVEVDHPVSTVYVEPGVTCVSPEGAWDAEADASGLDTGRPGLYHIEYSCEGRGATSIVYRTVHVVDG